MGKRTVRPTAHLLSVGLIPALLILVCGFASAQPRTVTTFFFQTARIAAADGAEEDLFGWVSVSGDTAVIGAPGADGDTPGQGAAYVFYRSQGGADAWGQVAKLTAADGATGDEFGYSVSVNGDTAVVGASRAIVGGDIRPGAAYVFYRDQGGADAWGQVAKLIAADAAAGDNFGCAVSISGDTAIIGASYANVGGTSGQGAVYVFYRDEGDPDAWGQVAKLTASDGAEMDNFGYSVSLSGDTTVIGSGWATVGSNAGQGAAYVFYRDEDGPDAWGQATKLTAADGAAQDFFGYSVSINGDTTLIAAPRAAIDGTAGQGAAYIFYRDQGGPGAWGQVAKLIAADGAAEDCFGFSVSANGDTAIVGSAWASVGGNVRQGAAYIFYRDEGGPDAWGQAAKLTAAGGATDDCFGRSVSISSDTATIGAPWADVGGNANQGAAYIFARFEPITWVYLPVVLRSAP